MARSDFWFSFPFRIRYSEVDGQSIVFNAHYLTYYDTAISEYLRALAYDVYAVAVETGTDFHTVKTLVEYLAPIRFDDEIDVFVRTSRIGRSSMTFALEIHPKNENRVLATGEVVWVNALVGKHESTPVPEKLVASIAEREPEYATR